MTRDRIFRSFDLMRHVLRLLRYSNARLTWLVVIGTLIESTLAILALFAIKWLVDSVTSPAASQTATTFLTPQAQLAIGVTVAVIILGRIAQSATAYLNTRQSLLVADVVNGEIQKRTVAADLSFFDSALYFDSLERAREAGAQRPAQVVTNALAVLRSLIMLAGITIVIINLDWIILPGILVALALTFLVQIKATSARFLWLHKRTQLERQASYIDWLLTSDLYAKEMRLFDAGPGLQTKFRALRETIRNTQTNIERVKAVREAAVALIAGLVFIGSAWLVITGADSSLGNLVMLVVVFQRAENAGRSAVQNLSRLYDDQLFLGQLFDFLSIEPKIQTDDAKSSVPQTINDGLRVENLHFSYPRSTDETLKGVSLHFPPGKFIAIVGGNGSGKTSLIKLICRLYDPQNGKVTLDGQDIRDFDPKLYRKEFGVVFQDFARFAFSAGENIRLGDTSTSPEDPDTQARIVTAAQRAGAAEIIEALPSGYDTMLARLFDGGEELSGGQWQRVALARAFFPNSRFMILDEPTSATDPEAEAALFEGFREKIGNKTAIVISHRLSTIRHADYTYVLKNGEIIEEGTHSELMKRRESNYREMFRSQIEQ